MYSLANIIFYEQSSYMGLEGGRAEGYLASAIEAKNKLNPSHTQTQILKNFDLFGLGPLASYLANLVRLTPINFKK